MSSAKAFREHLERHLPIEVLVASVLDDAVDGPL
jgi:hypothetical protein